MAPTTRSTPEPKPTKDFCPGDPKGGHSFISTFDGKWFIFLCGNCPYTERADPATNRRMKKLELDE